MNKNIILTIIASLIIILLIIIITKSIKNNTFENISCSDTETMQTLKDIRNNALFNVLDRSKYYFSSNYKIEYKNIITNQVDKESNKYYCKAQEVIKNLFFADENVYIVCDFEYTTQLTSDNKRWVETGIMNTLLDYRTENTCRAYDVNNNTLNNTQVRELLEPVNSENE